MIRTLRKKFIAIAMLSLLGTMTVLCATIGIGNYCVAASRADKAIDILYQNDGEFPVPDGNASPSAHAGFQVTPETPFETRYFIARLTAEDAVSAVDLEHIAALDRQTVVSTIEQIVSKGTAKGYVGQYRFGRFENKTSGYTLIVVDCFMQLQSAYAVFRVMAAVFVLCAGIVFLLLLVLSKRATRPFAENWERQRQFVTDASHELKTPLAILSADLGLIEETEDNCTWLESGQEQIQRLAGFPRLAVHHGFELLARDGAFRQIADAQHVVELQRIAVTGFERGIGAGELFGEVGAVDVVVFALVFRRQTGRVDLMQDAEGFAVHAAVENGFGQIDPCAVDPRAVAVALGQGEHSAGVVVGRVDVVVVVLLVDLLRQGDPFARVFRCGEFVAPRCDAEILRAAVCVAPFDDTVELFERLLMAIGTVGTTRTDAEEQDGEKERERFHAFVFDSRFSPRRTPHGSGGAVVRK